MGPPRLSQGLAPVNVGSSDPMGVGSRGSPMTSDESPPLYEV